MIDPPHPTAVNLAFALKMAGDERLNSYPTDMFFNGHKEPSPKHRYIRLLLAAIEMELSQPDRFAFARPAFDEFVAEFPEMGRIKVKRT